jgi:hypothetical protein
MGFVGLDVSLKATSLGVLDEAGTRVFEGKAATDPAVLARLIRKRAPEAVRVGLESGHRARLIPANRGPEARWERGRFCRARGQHAQYSRPLCPFQFPAPKSSRISSFTPPSARISQRVARRFAIWRRRMAIAVTPAAEK